MVIQLKELDNDNWLETANLSVSEKQKEFFPIPNIYWIGISRYEEHTNLYAIMLDETIIGLIGLGYDEDGVSGFINPLMIDANYQHHHSSAYFKAGRRKRQAGLSSGCGSLRNNFCTLSYFLLCKDKRGGNSSRKGKDPFEAAAENCYTEQALSSCASWTVPVRCNSLRKKCRRTLLFQVC